MNPNTARLLGPDDLVAIGLHFLLNFFATLIVCGLVAFFLYRARERIPAGAMSIALIPLLAWAVYFATTYRSVTTLILLDSESSKVAEVAYKTRFRNATLDEAVHLAINARQPPNVRFYAACLIADNLATNVEARVQQTMRIVDASPIIEAQFIGENELTKGFYISGRAQPRLTVRQIVERRLQGLHK